MSELRWQANVCSWRFWDLAEARLGIDLTIAPDVTKTER